jgi:hypothetical protein
LGCSRWGHEARYSCGPLFSNRAQQKDDKMGCNHRPSPVKM